MGILALIAGSWIPGIYYGFYCHSTASQIYWNLHHHHNLCNGNSNTILPHASLETIPHKHVYNAWSQWNYTNDLCRVYFRYRTSEFANGLEIHHLGRYLLSLRRGNLCVQDTRTLVPGQIRHRGGFTPVVSCIRVDGCWCAFDGHRSSVSI
ncbi:hypothetical protein D6D15_05444 [Aureobasidium pullulans]|uniref:Uncharacterized protein n=1 Tax=Aureobasidium pullulans TaxID=5580 RepID=A0A4S9B869_AURPU|nr:hypothetical protein D6D15_05444 [Aureobasidium pullulans]